MSKIISNQNSRTHSSSKKVGEDDKIGDEIQAKVVACAGVPGLTEPFFFDILSRFIIVMVEPCSYVPTNATIHKRYLLVKRPRYLWVDCPAAPDLTPANNHGSTRRKDYLGNINIGNPANFTINTIPKLDTEYTIGESITIRKVPRAYSGQSDIFNSQFSNVDFSNYYTDAQFTVTNPKRTGKTGIEGNELAEVMEWSPAYWASHGSGFTEDQLRSIVDPTTGKNRGPEWHKLKPLLMPNKIYSHPIKPVRSHDPQYLVPNEKTVKQNAKGEIAGGVGSRTTGNITENNFFMILHYYLIDSFMREQFPAYSTTIQELQQKQHRYQTPNGQYVEKRGKGRGQITSDNLFPGPNDSYKIFNEDVGQGKKVPRTLPNKDYSFINKNVVFSFCEWEDTNQGNKQRSSRDECMPLVIASPNNFPTPKERKIGSIIYEPAYAKVVAAQNDS